MADASNICKRKVFQDLTGQQFGCLTVVRLLKKGSGGAVWLCRCSCGEERSVRRGNINPKGRGAHKCSCLSRKSLEERMLGAIAKAEDGCWEWHAGLGSQGYGYITIRGRQHKAHRIAYQLWKGVVPDNLMVCHHCDNPRCVRPDHLFLGTAADNHRDMMLKARGPVGDKNGMRKHPERTLRGERNASAKLTAEQVMEIRRQSATGENVASLMQKFAVGESCIRAIINYESWKHV